MVHWMVRHLTARAALGPGREGGVLVLRLEIAGRAAHAREDLAEHGERVSVISARLPLKLLLLYHFL